MSRIRQKNEQSPQKYDKKMSKALKNTTKK